MSVSLWRWSPECDDELCVGDCDLCGFEPDDYEEPVDLELGFNPYMGCYDNDC